MNELLILAILHVALFIAFDLVYLLTGREKPIQRVWRHYGECDAIRWDREETRLIRNEHTRSQL